MKIAPSILDADFGQLQADLDSIKTADRIHLDIMDGHYVPNLSFGAPVLKGLSYPVETEAHLMVNNPAAFFDMFLAIGCETITFHIVNTGIQKALMLMSVLKDLGVKAGISIDGYSDPAFLTDEILGLADQVLVMSVKAGFGGQSFMTASIDKIKTLRDRAFTGEIEVDGGVNLDNAPELAAAGADILVVGSFLMKKSVSERAAIIHQFQNL